jgi:hypothetical protein
MSIEQPGHMDPYAHHILTGERTETGTSLLTLAEEKGADFDVSYLEASYLNPSSGCLTTPKVMKGKYEGDPLNVFVVRSDNGATIGLHSHQYPRTDGYKPVLRTAESLFPNTADSITLFGQGEKVVFSQNIGKSVDLGNGDVLKPMLYWTSSLNGKWATAVFNVMERLFCQNQLVSATPIIKVKHTTNHDHLLTLRAQILSEQVRRAEVFVDMARALKDQEFTNFQFLGLTHDLVPDPEEPDPATNKVNNCVRKRSAMNTAWRKERDEWGFNRWAAYNAIQGAEQHRILARVRNGRYDHSRSLERAMDGKAILADRALSLLLSA